MTPILVSVQPIYDVYAKLHPSLYHRSYWRMGIEEWDALLADERLQAVVWETPGPDPLTPARDRRLLNLPVSIESYGEVQLVTRVECRRVSTEGNEAA